MSLDLNWPRWMLNHAPSDCDPLFHTHCVRLRFYFGHATQMWNLLDKFCDPSNILVDGLEFVDEFAFIQKNNLLCDSEYFVNQTSNQNIYDDHVSQQLDQKFSQHTSRHKPTKKSKYHHK